MHAQKTKKLVVLVLVVSESNPAIDDVKLSIHQKSDKNSWVNYTQIYQSREVVKIKKESLAKNDFP